MGKYPKVQFCYIDVANITKIFQSTKAVNANCLIFNVTGQLLTFVSSLSNATAGECPMKMYFFTSGLVKRRHS